MACGKAVFVFDHFGGDGWVTPERYPAMEADNFAGQSRRPISTPELLDDELDRYSPGMGTVNRELTTAHHGARAHTAELCALLRDADPPAELDGAPLRELARLVRLQWLAEVRALNLEERSRQASGDAERARAELARARLAHADELDELTAQLERERADYATAVSTLDAELDGLRALTQTRRVRLGVRLGAIADSARRTIPTR